MKKIAKILSVALCLAMVLSMAAFAFAAEDKTANMVATELGLENGVDFVSHTIGDITFSGDIGANERNTPKFYTYDSTIRVYSGNVITITPAEGYEIASITVNTVSDKYTLGKAGVELTNVASSEGLDGVSSVLTPADGTKAVVITNDQVDNTQLRITSITVTYAQAGEEIPGGGSDVEPLPPTGDTAPVLMAVVALMAAAGLIVLVQKKRAF